MEKKKYVGFTNGTINDQPYESETKMVFLENGTLVGDIIIKKLPTGFTVGHQSLSNSSQKIGLLSLSNDGNPNIYEFLKEKGSVITSRIYTYPDFPDASLSQFGKAVLTKEGIEYKNTIIGYTGSLPDDIIEIKPYIQKITKRKEGGLLLKASTIIVSKSKGEIKTEIIGTYTFEGDKDYPFEYNIEHKPIFEFEGQTDLGRSSTFNGELKIKMSQSVISK